MRGCCRTSSDSTTLSLRSFQTTLLTSSRLTISELLLLALLCFQQPDCALLLLQHIHGMPILLLLLSYFPRACRPCQTLLPEAVRLLKLWLQLCLSSASPSQLVSLGMNSMHSTKLCAFDWTLIVDRKLSQHLPFQQCSYSFNSALQRSVLLAACVPCESHMQISPGYSNGSGAESKCCGDVDNLAIVQSCLGINAPYGSICQQAAS